MWSMTKEMHVSSLDWLHLFMEAMWKFTYLFIDQCLHCKFDTAQKSTDAVTCCSEIFSVLCFCSAMSCLTLSHTARQQKYKLVIPCDKRAGLVTFSFVSHSRISFNRNITNMKAENSGKGPGAENFPIVVILNNGYKKCGQVTPKIQAWLVPFLTGSWSVEIIR